MAKPIGVGLRLDGARLADEMTPPWVLGPQLVEMLPPAITLASRPRASSG